MRKQVKRTVLLLMSGVILFATSMAFPAIQNSKARDFFQGGGIGLLFAGIISIGIILYDNYFKKNKA